MMRRTFAAAPLLAIAGAIGVCDDDAARTGRTHHQSGRGLYRHRQDHRPHHHLRRLYRRDGAVRRAAGDAARLLLAADGTEEPKTDSFVEVDEITLDRKIRRIFTGWMFAESPGLNAVEHAVYDVWLKSCKQKSDVPRRSRQDESSGESRRRIVIPEVFERSGERLPDHSL